MKNTPRHACEAFVRMVETKLRTVVPGREEDQLRRPVDELLESIGRVHKLTVVAKDESTLQDQFGRPDFAVAVGGLLSGYLELKAPGTGADPRTFKGHNQRQWQRFEHLPNLVYTDGCEWTLVHSGELVRQHCLIDSFPSRRSVPLSDESVQRLSQLLLEFFRWEPIVPKSAAHLAQLLAPLCRLLRDDVLDALEKQSEAMLAVARDWRRYLFPEASNDVFADSYAQTVVFALLLARSDGSDTLFIDKAIKQLTASNSLLSRALEVLTDPQLENDIGASLGLLQRMIQAVPAGTMSHGRREPWLHFYEDFLAEYDPKLRKDVGAYYTPVEVVQAQVKLIDELLRMRLGKRLGFADGDVATLDPAIGTGTYLLGIIEHAMERVRAEEGNGAVIGRAESLIKQLYGFEIMVGPYAVAALRVTRMIHDFGAKVPRQGVGICLNNTLESPHEQIPELPLLYRPIGDEHKRARSIKDIQPVLVCIGNPPYDRHEAATQENRAMTGAWVRYGESKTGTDAILNDFIGPVSAAGKGVQLKNLYNLYVYFWRWALWKVFEHEHPNLRPGPGIVSYISASSYLDGEAFMGMREWMRRTCDEIWIIDLGGEGRGTRQDENVFNIKTPVAIAIAVRYGAPQLETPAQVHYARFEGTRKSKLDRLERINGFADLSFETCPSEWHAPFRPQEETDFFTWPLITDIMPWQTSGVQIKRTWPIGPTKEVLEERWNALLTSRDRSKAFKATRDRTVESRVQDLWASSALVPLVELEPGTPVPEITRYGYRSFDRQWLIYDNRLSDYLRPTLWQTQSNRQLYFASLLYSPLGEGPALTVSADVPDLHYFSGRGAKDILPLYRDRATKEANVSPTLLRLLQKEYSWNLDGEDVGAYLYAVLAHSGYVRQFHKQLENRKVRVPITKNAKLFRDAVEIGRRLIFLHTFGERCARGQTWPSGRARCTRAVPTDEEAGLPESYSYDEATKTVVVGQGVFAPVDKAVWDFRVSGLNVLQSWLAYRIKERKGRKSSPLDNIAPRSWSSEFTSELLRLLHLLEDTLAMYPIQERLLTQIVQGALIENSEIEPVLEQYRRAAIANHAQHKLGI